MHFKPVHGNRYELKETSEDFARKFRIALDLLLHQVLHQLGFRR